MALFDMPLEQLAHYLPQRAEPADFDAFWAATLADARSHPLAPRFVPHATGLRHIGSFDVTFNGFAGQPIRGWLNLPRQRSGTLPCVVTFLGYGGGRGFAHDWLLWPSAGYAQFVMDTRGQGSAWSPGVTPDPDADGSPHFPGFMTRGIAQPTTFYYRRVFTDAVRAVEAARAHAAVDATRIAVAGGSQGGGIALAAAALVPDVALALVDVPFLCHFQRALEITDAHPYQEIVRYLMTHRDQEERVLATLAYCDGMHMAARAQASALFSVGLMDQVCPPSTVYAAYNHYAGPRRIAVWRYNQHEGGASFQARAQLAFVHEHWGASDPASRVC
ncbi:MAG: acetylxylan esterase [Candidatus Viridilinea halotolerans]|uniref:Acetylxylan esterase n=1 Tax=Candidatus Viridilinea halotolerans TaxID=2491704 RepID=A0A426U3N6_9CHLR|nr:MAG: acetylxylan esterase [Candidatus Viridilinea halotolerans]